jgi:hypothetical protein
MIRLGLMLIERPGIGLAAASEAAESLRGLGGIAPEVCRARLAPLLRKGGLDDVARVTRGVVSLAADHVARRALHVFCVSRDVAPETNVRGSTVAWFCYRMRGERCLGGNESWRSSSR